MNRMVLHLAELDVNDEFQASTPWIPVSSLGRLSVERSPQCTRAWMSCRVSSQLIFTDQLACPAATAVLSKPLRAERTSKPSWRHRPPDHCQNHDHIGLAFHVQKHNLVDVTLKAISVCLSKKSEIDPNAEFNAVGE